MRSWRRSAIRTSGRGRWPSTGPTGCFTTGRCGWRALTEEDDPVGAWLDRDPREALARYRAWRAEIVESPFDWARVDAFLAGLPGGGAGAEGCEHRDQRCVTAAHVDAWNARCARCGGLAWTWNEYTWLAGGAEDDGYTHRVAAGEARARMSDRLGARVPPWIVGHGDRLHLAW